jgi:hypothetical protein
MPLRVSVPRPVSLVLVLLVAGLALALSGAAARAQGSTARIPAAPTTDVTSPGTASGPIQAGVQVRGQGWNPNETVKLYYNLSTAQPPNPPDCGNPANAAALSQSQGLLNTSLTADSGGTWVANFQWPGTNTGQYAICAFDPSLPSPPPVTPASRSFTVLSNQAPTLATPPPAFYNAGDMVNVVLNNFLPGNQPVDVKITNSLANQAQAMTLTTLTVDNNGSATQQVTLPLTLSGNLQIFAASHAAPGAATGALPPLFASQGVTITAATPTPVPTSTVLPSPTAAPPTATAVPTSTGTGTTPKTSTGSAVLTVLVVLLGLVILAIFGVLIWYFVGIRPPPEGGAFAPPAPPPPARTRAPVLPQGGTRGRYAQPPEEDEWEDQQGPWEEDAQGGWSGNDWQQSEQGPPRRGGGGRSMPPARSGSGGPPSAPRPGPRDEWQRRPPSNQEEW